MSFNQEDLSESDKALIVILQNSEEIPMQAPNDEVDPSDDEASTPSDEGSQTSSDDDDYMVCVLEYDIYEQSSDDTADRVVNPEVEDVPPDPETIKWIDVDIRPGPHRLPVPRPVPGRETAVVKFPFNPGGRPICPYCEIELEPDIWHNSLGEHLLSHDEVRRAVSRYCSDKSLTGWHSVAVPM